MAYSRCGRRCAQQRRGKRCGINMESLWLCNFCYISLFELVSHVRAIHSVDPGLRFVCNVNGCPAVFKQTNTWYKHVTKKHQEQYDSTLLIESRESRFQEDIVAEPYSLLPQPPFVLCVQQLRLGWVLIALTSGRYHNHKSTSVIKDSDLHI